MLLRAMWIRGLAVALLAMTTISAQQRTTPGPEVYSRLHWRTIGPEGNRFSAAAGVPGDPYTYYVGSASGGIFKTIDGGVNWTPIFDAQPVQSIGALAVAQVGSERRVGGHRRRQDSQPHLRRPGRVSLARCRQDVEPDGPGANGTHHPPGRSIPTDPNIVLVCALGHAYGPQPERGVFRTTDGGQTWAKTLFVDENTGCSDIAMDPKNPRILFAGMWQLEIRTWGRESGGPGSGLFMSRDGGVTWTRLTGRGLADAAGRQGRGRDRRVESQPRLRADRNGRRRALEGPAHRSRSVVALGQRRRHVAGRELRPQRHGPRTLLLAHGRRAGRRRRGVFPDGVVRQVDRWRPHLDGRARAPKRRAAIITTSGSIRPTRTGRSSPTTRASRSPSTAARRGSGSG